jgi:hypothetical protein
MYTYIPTYVSIFFLYVYLYFTPMYMYPYMCVYVPADML